MLVGDFKIFLIELIVIIVFTMVVYHVFDCVAGFVLQILFIASTVISAVVFSVWIGLSVDGNAFSYIFWVAAPMILFALMSILAWEYPFEIAGIRLVMALFGAYYVDYYSDVYGVAMVLAVQYVVFALYLMGTIGSLMDE